LIATPDFEGMPKEEPGIIRIPAFKRVNKTIFSLNFPVSGLLTRYMREFSPDILHSHSPFFIGDFAVRLSRQHATPLVLTYHTMFEQYPHDWPVQNEGMKRFLIKYTSGYTNLLDQVIVPSESVRDILLKRGVRTPMEVVPTGIDLERFSKGDRKAFRKQNDIPQEALVIGYAGRLAPEKNLGFLTNCLVEVLKKDPRIHILVVGQGPSEKMIKDIFSQAGFEKRLHLTGALHYQHLVDAYFAMDLFAFASLSETQGMVLVEAMAASVPVVALDAPGAREVVVDHINGRLLNEMDQQSFIDALLWVLHRPSEELQIIKNAARKTAQKYPIDSTAKHMLEIYEKIRLKKSISLGKRNSSQYLFLWRIKTEWDLYNNFFKAIAKSMFEGDFEETEPVKIHDTTGEYNHFLTTEDGKRIAFFHIRRGSSKVIIIAHGIYNNKDTVLFRRMAEGFSKEYDVVMFDFRGHGKSGGVFTWTAQEQKDLRAIVAYAKKSNYTKIGVIGFSFGAAVVLIEASRHQSIDSVIAVSPPADLNSIDYHFWEKDMWKDLKLNFGIKGRGKGVRPGNPFLKKIRPVDVVDKISPTPVLFLHGEKDWLIKPRHSQRLFDKAKDPKAMTIIKDGGHAERMFDVFPDQFIKICLERFKETL
jgi:glycosyltransferase involved in cell wall biosynthesis/pimeloyl-ACP methyl ester carboxylesterase